MSQFQSTLNRRKPCPVPGIYWHESSQQFLSQVGYHEIQSMDRKGRIKTRRIRSTQQLGPSEADAVLRLYSLKQEWGTIKKEWRKRRNQAKHLERFVPLPVWPKRLWSGSKSPTPAQNAPEAPQTIPAPSPLPIIQTGIPDAANLTLTILQARERFLAIMRNRIGKLAGKGMNENTYSGAFPRSSPFSDTSFIAFCIS